MKVEGINKEALHAAIRTAVAANGGKRISYRHFIATMGLKYIDVFHNYTKWQDALCGAGFDFYPYHSPPPPYALFAEWAAVVRKLGKLPSHNEYRFHVQRDAGSLRLHCGSWSGVPAAFRRFARKTRKWADVTAMVDTHLQNVRPPPPRITPKPRPITPRVRRGRRLRDRDEFGDQLDLPSLRHSPSNESGVIYLFGIMAERLGFAVERMQSKAFPDCFAKRRILSRHSKTTPDARGAKWQNVTIEFEYESRNFRIHRHDPAGCDIIICWSHNWPDCPETLEVIALDEELKRPGGRSFAKPPGFIIGPTARKT